MQTFTKLLVLVVLNIAGLSGVLFYLIRSNYSPQGSILLAWRMIVLGRRNQELRGALLPDGASILSKTWWLMIGLTTFFWMIQPGRVYTCLGGLLIGLHILWYFLGKASDLPGDVRMFELNAQWGMVYLAVHPDSCLNAKTLSELDLRKKNLLVLAIERQRRIVPFPKGMEVILPGDRLVIFGDLNYFRGLEV